MRRMASMLLALSLLLTGCSAATARNGGDTYQITEREKLVIYTSHKEEVYGPIIREFEARTDIFVEIIQEGSLELFNEITKNAGGQDCDVVFGGGVENYITYQDYLEAYRVPEEEMIDERYRCVGHKWTAFSVLPIVFIYNNKLVYPEAAPGSWSELLTERWKGRVAFADPAVSGSSYTALCTMLQALDGDEDELLQSFIQVLDGQVFDDSRAVLEEVNSGSMLVGITLESTAREWISQGADLSFLYPEEGTSTVPDAAAILQDAPHRENAQKFMDFIVSQDVQRLLVEQLFRQTIRVDIDGADVGTENDTEVPRIDYDIVWAVQERDALLAKWAGLQKGP